MRIDNLHEELNLLVTRDDELFLLIFNPENIVRVMDTATHHAGGTHILVGPSSLAYYTLKRVSDNFFHSIGNFTYYPPYSSPLVEGDGESQDWLIYLSHLLHGYKFNGIDFLLENLQSYSKEVLESLLSRFILTSDINLVNRLRVLTELTSE